MVMRLSACLCQSVSLCCAHRANCYPRLSSGSWKVRPRYFRLLLSHASVPTQVNLSTMGDHGSENKTVQLYCQPMRGTTVNHQHTSSSGGIGTFLRSRAGLVLLAFLAIAGFYLVTEHTAHVFGFLPYLLILLCPILHLFMHRGHGGHGGHENHEAHQSERTEGDQR